MADEPATQTVDAPSTTLGPRRLRLIAAIAAVVLIADQASKAWALEALDGGEIIEVVGSLRFNLYFNTGVSFSLGSDNAIGPWIAILVVVVVAVVSLGSTSRTTLGAVASGLISGGAIGNVVDRAFRGDDGFMHGAVVDFIDLQWWPVFNIADAAVVVGALLLIVASFKMPSS